MLWVGLLLAATPQVTTPAGADDGLPCHVHAQFLEALEARKVRPTEPARATFQLQGGRWRFALESAGRVTLRRELDVPCEEAGAVAALMVERAFASLVMKRPTVVGKPVAPSPPVSSPPVEPTPEPTPVEPLPMERAPVEPVELPPEPVRVVMPPVEPLPRPTPPVEPVDAPPEPVRVVIPPVEPPPSSRPLVSPLVAVGAWWEVPARLWPSLTLGVDVEVRPWWRVGALVASGLPQAQLIRLDETRSGQLSVWSLSGAVSAGLCHRFERVGLCADAVFALRVARGEGTGALYQRQPVVFLLPSAGLRAELLVRLTRLLSLSAGVMGLVPFGQSTFTVEGTAAAWTSPIVDVLGSVGIRFSL